LPDCASATAATYLVQGRHAPAHLVVLSCPKLRLRWSRVALTIPLSSTNGRIFTDVGMPPPPTIRSFASSTAFVAASHVIGGSAVRPRQEVGVEEEGRRDGKEDNSLHES
jgi:hypothetical protein